jgi:hypothetical protein
MSSDDDLSVIIFMVLGTASAVAAAAGTFFGTRKQECQGEFTPWSPCVGECDEVPTRSRKYVITKSAPDCPYIDGYTETEACDQITPCCQLVRDWEDPGDVPCESGLKKFTRELKENAPGACEGFDTEQYTPCCDIIGKWEPVGECGDIKPGQQKETKYHLGECRSEDVEKFENCAPCVEGWDSYTTGLPSCPSNANDCGFSGVSFKRTWKITSQPVGTGKACTKADGTVEEEVCPAQPPCCDYTNWSTDGVCASDGQLTYTRNYVNSSCKEDPNMNNTKSYTDPCCYEAGWAPVEGCVEMQIPYGGVDEDGNEMYVTVNRQKQTQTTAGPCPEGTEERYVPCCGYTEWTPDGQCEEQQVFAQDAATGVMTYQTGELQRIKRDIGTTIEGCGKEEEPFTESLVPCCGYTAWENDGSCVVSETEGVEPSQAKIRSIIEPSEGCFPEEDTQSLEKTVDCCYEEDWATLDYCTLDETSGEYKQKYQRNVFGAACTETTNQTTKSETCENVNACPGTWDAYADGFPDCPEEGVCTDEITYTRNWAKEQAPAGKVYTNCPPDETKTCPAVPCDCEQGWDTSACPTEPGFVGNDSTQLKTWRVTTTGTGTGTCISDYEDGDTAPCDATALKQVECVGAWDEWDKACPTETECGYLGGDINRTQTWTTNTAPPGETYINCPPESQSETITCPATPGCEVPCEGNWDTEFPPCPTECGSEEVTYTRNWTTNTAPPGQTYVGCPPASESKTCPAVAACDEGVASGGVIGGGLITGIVAGTAGGAAAWYCATNPEKCNFPDSQPPSIRDDVDVNCVGEFDEPVPACVKTCGQSAVDYTATYKQIIPQQGGGAYCPYPDGYSYTRNCEATPPCCTYSTVPPLVTGPGVCNAPPGVATTAEVQVQVNNEPCQEDGTAPTSRYEPCTNCYGFWEADACPTGCGYPGGTVVKNWVTLTDSVGYGEACPSPTTMTCPATPACEQSCAA